VSDHYARYTSSQFIDELVALRTENHTLQSNLNLLQAELAQLKRMVFGSRSERFVPAHPDQQVLLFDVPTQAVVASEQTITYTRNATDKTTKHKGRLPLPAHLPRIEIVLEPEQDVTGLVCIGKEITEELDYTPGKFWVNQYIRAKYVVPQKGIVLADLPTRPIEKCIASAGLLASVLIEKYVDHLPLNRQLQRFKREHIAIAPSTIVDWVKQSCALLYPLYEVLKAKTLNSGYLMADETPIKVLEDSSKGSHQGYYWVYRAVQEKLILFDYRPSRAREGPKSILENYSGFLQTDGYSAYDNLNTKQPITLVNCMAHARRYFEQALDNDPQRATYMLEQIKLLYTIERNCREQNYTHQQRQELRQQESKPILHDLHTWLKENILQVLPKSSIGKAIAYALERWEKLCLYADHGQLEIDNNPVENAIRPVALGRKNYLFAGSDGAAQRAAMIYSLLATAKANGIEPYNWLVNTLRVLPDHKANRLHELLPIAQ
jgi:transposase